LGSNTTESSLWLLRRVVLFLSAFFFGAIFLAVVFLATGTFFASFFLEVSFRLCVFLDLDCFSFFLFLVAMPEVYHGSASVIAAQAN
jgi:hypothetical protein